jgi:transcriptional antiterminator NusG
MGGPHCDFSQPPAFQPDLGNQQLGPRRAKPYLAMHIDCQESVDPGVVRTLQPLEWFALRTRPRHEKVVTQQLESSGVEAFLPTCDQVRTWSDRKKVVEFPLFPGYVFVRTSQATPARARIFQARGVLGFVGPNNQGTPIPPQQIESVRALMQEQVHCRPHPYLTVGQRVRIQDGALKGLEGILVRVASDQSLIVSVDLIQRSVAIRLEGYEVDGL